MLPLILSLGLAAGVALVYDGLTRPEHTSHAQGLAQRMEIWLRRAGVHGVAARDFVVVSIAGGLAAGIVAQLWLGLPVVSVGAMGLGATLPAALLHARQERRQAAIEAAVVEAIGQLRDAIRAGLSVEAGVAGLAETGPALLRPEFAATAREARYVGFARALEGLRGRLENPLLDTALQTLALNDRLGGRQVGPVLDRLAQATRAQGRVRAEIRAAQAKQVLAARIVALVPFLVLLVLRTASPGYASFFATPAGEAWLAGCVVSVALGYGMMRRLARLPQ